MRKRYCLYAHGGSGNHGCEALVRSTCAILEAEAPILLSHAPNEDQSYGLSDCCTIPLPTDVKRSRISFKYLMAYLRLKLYHDFSPLDALEYESRLTLARRGDVALSIGGDNYCYGKESSLIFTRYRKLLQKRGVKTVLWGCSVSPELIDDELRDDLSRYDLITARESITYQALRQINPNTILAPDPAFMLARQPGQRPTGLGCRPYIGINISPLIQGLETGEDIALANYRTLIHHILRDTDRDIALIPHVVWTYNDDRIPLRKLHEEFLSTGRVFLIEDQNCMQLKDIISGCDFFVGARTHSTIAAYSTCVPTLVVGYSVKARGIARDLFGTEEGYVLPVQQLREKDDLTNAFKALYSRKEEIRKHLTDKIPGYIQGIHSAKEAVEKL